jgi:hypothetical protein
VAFSYNVTSVGVTLIMPGTVVERRAWVSTNEQPVVDQWFRLPNYRSMLTKGVEEP